MLALALLGTGGLAASRLLPPAAQAGTATGRVAITKTHGAGFVISTPPGINCDPACRSQTYDFPAGRPVLLSAVGQAGSPFTGWSGACAGTAGAVCTITPVAGAVTRVGVQFGGVAPATAVVLRVRVTGGGGAAGLLVAGRIPPGAARRCYTDCAYRFGVGDIVAVTPFGPDHARFLGFGRDPDCGGAGCALVMSRARTVTGLFGHRAIPPRTTRVTPPRRTRATPPKTARATPPKTARATPPASTLAVTKGASSARRTTSGWSILVIFRLERRVAMAACLLRSGTCATTYPTTTIEGGSRALVFPVPSSVGRGPGTMRLVFGAGATHRTLLWPVLLR